MTRILLVEDDTDIRELVGARLKAQGYLVRALDNASDALASVEQAGDPDVLVLDVGLPDMDGFELLHRLRQRPGTSTTPAIFLSAHVQEADVERGRAAGAVYLTKPFIASALLARVAEAAASVATTQADSW